MNKIIITGNVGSIEQKTMPDGSPVLEISVAVSNGKDRAPTWYKCASFYEKQQATLIQYVQKGSKLLIEGTPKANAYINKENKAVGTINITISSFEFLGGKEKETQETQETGFNAPAPVLTSDDIQF